ncbi:MAG: thioredoxin family protein [Gemmatimonadota bacterium]
MTGVLLALLLGGGCTILPAPGAPLAAVSDSLGALYTSGKTWKQFFDGAKSRREMWKGNFERGEPDAELVERARAVAGSWKILAVAEDWCGDSANTVPYLVRLTEQVPSIEIRIVNSKDGQWVMAQHRTADGRTATPTILLLDGGFGERGCIVESPAKLRAWVVVNKSKLSDDDYHTQKMAWYKADRGRETVRDLVEALEAAAQGTTKCAGR